MAITVIIVTHNSAQCIAAALQCIVGHSLVTDCWVVDNASNDGTTALVVQQFPQVRIISNSVNRGFGNACNQALEQVTTEFALLMNPDARIDPEGITTLVACARDYSDAALVAPKITGNDFDASTDAFRAPVIDDVPAMPLVELIAPDIHAVRFVSGAIVLWRMELMRQVGFFDPAFFLFYEDDDLSVRVQRRGCRMLIHEAVHASHVPGTSCATSPQLDALKMQASTWSYLYVHRKYRGARAASRIAFMLARKSWWKLCTGNLTPPLKHEHKHRLAAALQFLKNPKHFQFRDDR